MPNGFVRDSAELAPRAPASAARVVIVIGASAGGIDPMREIVGALPPDLPAAVLVVLHMATNVPSVLPAILGRRAHVPVAHARDGETLRAGHVYVAPPDRHLRVVDGRAQVAGGPREHGVCPAVDPLFRSAALDYGPRAIGVVLSGTLDDGALGLEAIVRAGGVAVVQDPADARFDGMPRSACVRAAPEHVLPASAIGAVLARLATDRAAFRSSPLPSADTGGRRNPA